MTSEPQATKDDYYDDWYDPGEYSQCDCCGGDGVVEYIDHPGLWGEDCPSRVNHLLTCPECNGTGSISDA